ncbi:MAG: hypothetical protein PSX80_17405 [bacterium]|nr:hypothetical protein [bacterium]
MRVNSLRSSISIFGLILLSLACGGPGDASLDGTTEGIPQLTDEVIRQRLIGVRFGPIPEESGASEAISWRFFEDEPKEITIVEKNIHGNSATVLLDIKTTSGPRTRDPRQLAGQIRVEWQLESGMVLRRWEVVRTENISVKYKTLPKPPATPLPVQE